jgi:CGNR zinc finger
MSYSLARHVTDAAPGGLALVQGLLNTRGTGSGAVDLFDNRTTAMEWLAAGLAEWGRRTSSTPREQKLAPGELEKLRVLRQLVLAYVAGDREGIHLDVPVSITASRDGELRTQPVGAGIHWLESAVWGEVLFAQQAHTLRRLKLCRNEACGTAFYDRSRNLSGVWHDVHTCGNSANLRASRARRKSAA